MKDVAQAKKIFKFPDIPKSQYLVALFPKLQEEKSRNITTLVLTVIMLSFFGLFAINPTISTIVDLQKQISDQNFVSQQLTQKISNLSTLQNKYADLQPDLTYVDNALPTSPQLSDFIGMVQAIATSNNVYIPTLQTFPIDIGKSSNKLSSFSFSFEAQGSYNDVVSFIASLSKFERVISFDTIALNKSATQNSTLFFANIRGSAYFKP